MMSPIAKAGIKQLTDEKLLESVVADDVTATQLSDQAARHAKTAALGYGIGDYEGCFILSYDACRKLCTALLAACGLRAIGDGHHATTFEAAATLAENFSQRPAVVAAGELRNIRNGNEYRGEAVSPDDAKYALDVANDLVAAFDEPVRKIIATMS